MNITMYKLSRPTHFRKGDNLETDIHRKPTSTDRPINSSSNYTTAHKVVALTHHSTRIHSLPLTENRRQKEDRMNGMYNISIYYTNIVWAAIAQ